MGREEINIERLLQHCSKLLDHPDLQNRPDLQTQLTGVSSQEKLFSFRAFWSRDAPSLLRAMRLC